MKKLLVVWKSNHETDIHKFIAPYVYNSKVKQWFDEVDVLIWGSSQEKVRDDVKAQELIGKFLAVGINVYACKMCADSIGATEILESLGVIVIYTGVYLSDNQKNPEVEVISI